MIIPNAEPTAPSDIPPALPGPSGSHRAASLVTDVFAPAPVLAALLLAVGGHGGGGAGLAWAVGAGALCVGAPLAVVLLGVRAGRYTDVHVRVRRQRAVPLAMSLASAALCTFLLYVLGAPRELAAFVASVLAGLAAGAAVTVWWKVSGHTAVAGAALVVLTALYGPALLSVAAIVLVIAWSRVALRDHTVTQTAAGVVIGVAVPLAVFVPLR